MNQILEPQQISYDSTPIYENDWNGINGGNKDKDKHSGHPRNNHNPFLGGEAIASGGYGCVFKPALRCKNSNHRPSGKISKLMFWMDVSVRPGYLRNKFLTFTSDLNPIYLGSNVAELLGGESKRPTLSIRSSVREAAPKFDLIPINPCWIRSIAGAIRLPATINTDSVATA